MLKLAERTGIDADMIAARIVQEVLKELKLTEKDIGENMSKYAKKQVEDGNYTEFVAEAGAEAKHSETPRRWRYVPTKN